MKKFLTLLIGMLLLSGTAFADCNGFSPQSTDCDPGPTPYCECEDFAIPTCSLEGMVLFGYEGGQPYIAGPIECNWFSEVCEGTITFNDCIPLPFTCVGNEITIGDFWCYYNGEQLICPRVRESDMLQLGNRYYPPGTPVIRFHAY